ncbi:MAG: hypothetical protein ACOZF0_16305 [Thermodesulfobacteriota bacterium]
MKREINKIAIITTVLLTVFAASASAAPYWMNFWNEFNTDSVYLFITSGDVTFRDVDESRLAPSWGVDTFESNRLIFTGNDLGPNAGQFRIQFSDRDSFVMEWAEVLDGVVQSGHSGTLTFGTNGQIINAVYGPITSAVPIPESAWLLGSALICFVGIRRKTLKS